MIFLNPAILWGLFAAIIPILIHIFNLKKTKKLEFSTLMFLKEIQQTKYKRIKLKQLLLLLCRILIIVFLVMMFAKPVITSNSAIAGEDIRSSVLIVLDNSFSLETRNKNITDFERAKEKTFELIDALGNNNEIIFTATSDIKEKNTAIKEANTEKLKEHIKAVNFSSISVDLYDVLIYSKEILNSALYDYKEIYYITDGQKTYIERTNYPDISSELGGIKTNLILISSREPNNISIDSINIISKVFQKNKPVKIKALINNHNNFNILNSGIILTSGQIRQEEIADFNSNTITEKEFIFKPERTGYINGSIEIANNNLNEDEIYSDNKQYFSFYIPEKIKTLIVSENSEDAKFIKLVLNTSQENNRTDNTETVIKYDEINSTDLSKVNLNEYNSIIFSSKKEFTSNDREKLNDYINNGGGVIFYLGNGINIKSYNELFSLLGYPLIEGAVSYTQTDVFENFDYNHPVTEGIFKADDENRKYKPEAPDIKDLVLVKGGGNSVSAITLPNGYNFLTEFTGKKGRVLVYSVSGDFTSSDFPENNLFFPLTYRSVIYCSNVNEGLSYIAGNGYLYFSNLPIKNSDSLYIINTQNDKTENVIFAYYENVLIPVYEAVKHSGNFIVKLEGKELNMFSVNFDKREASIQRFNYDELAKFIESNFKYSVNVLKEDDNMRIAISESKGGKQVWKLFLILVIGFVIAEYFIAKSLNKAVKV